MMVMSATPDTCIKHAMNTPMAVRKQAWMPNPSLGTSQTCQRMAMCQCGPLCRQSFYTKVASTAGSEHIRHQFDKAVAQLVELLDSGLRCVLEQDIFFLYLVLFKPIWP